jgi:hypothetical protein
MIRLGLERVSSSPSNTARPAWGRTSPESDARIVDLPAPLAPISVRSFRPRPRARRHEQRGRRSSGHGARSARGAGPPRGHIRPRVARGEAANPAVLGAEICLAHSGLYGDLRGLPPPRAWAQSRARPPAGRRPSRAACHARSRESSAHRLAARRALARSRASRWGSYPPRACRESRGEGPSASARAISSRRF